MRERVVCFRLRPHRVYKKASGFTTSVSRKPFRKGLSDHKPVTYPCSISRHTGTEWDQAKEIRN